MSNNTTLIYKKGFPHYLVSDIILYIVSLIIVIINLVIVLMFLVQRFRRPAKSRLSPAGALVLNLLISDALVGAMGIYITASFSESGGAVLTPYGCVNRITPRFFFRMGSHMALIAVAIDRYIAIAHTLRYRDWVTMERCLMLIAIGWLLPLAGTAYAYFDNDWSPNFIFCYEIKSFVFFLTYVRLPAHLITWLCIVVIQCRIFLYLKNHEKHESPQFLRKYSRKSARILFWVTTTYVVCWLPFDVVLILLLFLHKPYFKILVDITVVLAYVSYLVNTFVFSYKTENIKKPVTDLWRDLMMAVDWEKKVASPEGNQVSVVTGINNRGSIYSTTSNTGSSNATSSSAVSRRENGVETAVHI